MAVYVDTSGSVQRFERILEAAARDGADGTLLILACDANAFTPEQLDPILCDVQIPIIGGIFPAILHDLTRLDNCISRSLFLGDQYPLELQAAFTPNQLMLGACTIGEIANTGNEFIEFYNKTAVFGVLGGA